MDSETLIWLLSEAEQHIAQGEQLLRRQREIVQRLSNVKGDTREARSILITLEESQALHIADRDRLRTQVAERGLGR